MRCAGATVEAYEGTMGLGLGLFLEIEADGGVPGLEGLGADFEGDFSFFPFERRGHDGRE